MKKMPWCFFILNFFIFHTKLNNDTFLFKVQTNISYLSLIHCSSCLFCMFSLSFPLAAAWPLVHWSKTFLRSLPNFSLMMQNFEVVLGCSRLSHARCSRCRWSTFLRKTFLSLKPPLFCLHSIDVKSSKNCLNIH